MSQIALGIYLQDHSLSIGFVTEKGQCLGSIRQENTDSATVTNLIKLCEDIQKKFNVVSFHKVGIVNESNERLQNAQLEKQLQSSIVQARPGAALAAYEYKWGHAVEEANFVAVSIHKSMDGGVFLNGQLAQGSQGLAGDLGNLLVQEHQELKRLSDYLSPEGIKDMAFQLISNQKTDSSLCTISYQDLTVDYLLNAVAKKDKLAIMVFERLGEVLGLKLSNISNYFSPKYFIIDSFSDQLSELLIKYAAVKMEEDLLPIFKNKIKVIGSKSQGEHAQVLQAAAITFA